MFTYLFALRDASIRYWNVNLFGFNIATTDLAHASMQLGMGSTR